MAGINLSQTDTAVKRKPGFFDSGTIAAFVLLLVVAGIYGGMRWYIFTLEKEEVRLEAILKEKEAELSGERVTRLADFGSRLKYVEQFKLSESVFSLGEFEKAVIPSVVVTKYVYDNESGRVTFSAATPAFKSLAQQIQTMKGTGAFTGVRVNEIKRLSDGGIIFSLEAQLVTDK